MGHDKPRQGPLLSRLTKFPQASKHTQTFAKTYEYRIDIHRHRHRHRHVQNNIQVDIHKHMPIPIHMDIHVHIHKLRAASKELTNITWATPPQALPLKSNRIQELPAKAVRDRSKTPRLAAVRYKGSSRAPLPGFLGFLWGRFGVWSHMAVSMNWGSSKGLDGSLKGAWGSFWVGFLE